MEPSQVEALRRGIDRGSKAEFGLVKLAKLDLNVLMQPPSDLAWAGGTMTLLSYAAARNRDAIVGALLRAGADATIRHGCCGAECGSLAARAHLSQLLPMTAAWTVKQVVGLRKAAAAIAGKGSSSGAGYEEAVTVAQQLTCCLCAGPLHAPSALAFPCTHLCCEACLWQHLSHSGRLMCPCNQSSSQLQVWEGDDSAPVEMQQEAVCRKLASKARYEWPSANPSFPSLNKKDEHTGIPVPGKFTPDPGIWGDRDLKLSGAMRPQIFARIRMRSLVSRVMA